MNGFGDLTIEPLYWIYSRWFLKQIVDDHKQSSNINNRDLNSLCYQRIGRFDIFAKVSILAMWVRRFAAIWSGAKVIAVLTWILDPNWHKLPLNFKII